MNNKDTYDLPVLMKCENTCCFTGHRTLPKSEIKLIDGKLEHVIKLLCSSGYEYFICGGALGFDMLAEEAVIRAWETGLGAKLVLALPCRNQTEHWCRSGTDTSAVRKYQRIKGFAEAIIYISDFYTDSCMRERNRLMVSLSSLCVGYYNGVVRSGAGQTYRMAQKAGIKTYNIFDFVSCAARDD